MPTSPQPSRQPLGGIASSSSSSSSSGAYYDALRQQPQPPLPPWSSGWHYGDVSGNRSYRVHGFGVVFVLAVFSLLLFLAIIFLYALWARRYRYLVPRAARGRSDAALHYGDTEEPVTPSEPVKEQKGLTKEAIDRLPVVRIGKRSTAGDAANKEELLQCSICLGGLTEIMKVLPACGHGFHTDCVDLWLRLHASCPLCRASLDSLPVVDPLQAV